MYYVFCLGIQIGSHSPQVMYWTDAALGVEVSVTEHTALQPYWLLFVSGRCI